MQNKQKEAEKGATGASYLDPLYEEDKEGSISSSSDK